MRYLIFLLVLFSCRTKADDNTLDSPELNEIYDHLLASVQWEDGWPSKHDCDGTLWAGLACLGGVDVNMLLAEKEPGRVERRPGQSCYPTESASSVSKDMLTGYMGCLHKKRDLDALQRLYDYGKDNHWSMGEPSSAVGDVQLDPNRQGLLARFIVDLGGARRQEADITPVHLPVTADYARHLQMIEIQLEGSTNPLVMEIIKNNVRSNPDDALFQAILARRTGDFDKFKELVSNSNYTFPSYVRGADSYKQVHLLLALAIALGK